MKLSEAKVGDKVIRNLGGVEMPLTVTEITESRVICGAWEFDRATGTEIDEDLGWGPPPAFTHTGSVIQLVCAHGRPVCWECEAGPDTEH